MKREDKMKLVSLHMPLEMICQLHDAAEANGTTFSDLVRTGVTRHLATLPQAEADVVEKLAAEVAALVRRRLAKR